MDEFTCAYITALLWSTVNLNTENCLDADFDGKPGEFDPTTLERIKADCAKFQDENSEDLSDDSQAGHDFALTRNCHGTGFWDRENLSKPVRDRLTKAAHAFGEFNLYVGDDGKLYV